MADPLDLDRAIDQDILRLRLSNQWIQRQIEEELRCLHLNGELVHRIGEVFLHQLELGIRDKPSSLQMENTYIPELPDGTEEGQFLALDLGGTNFRVLLLELHEGRLIKEYVKHYHISDELRIGAGVELFDFLAECIANFVHEHDVASKLLPMGFTFSFPMHQRALDVGIVVTWTKSFRCSGVVGMDAVEMLRQAINRRGDNHVEVVAVLNDTTGTLMQGALFDHRTSVGLILGTGSNACYLERADRVFHWESERHGEKEIVIDVEWGAFGDNGVLDFIRTAFDREVDDNSLIKQSFTFEKYIGGKYLGELVRIILVHLAKKNLLFNGNISKKFATSGRFTTNFVSHIEQDSVDDVSSETENILSEFDQDYNLDDIAVVKLVCELVSLRAALLVSVCTAEILKHMDRPDVTVAVDGSLYKHHPRMKHWIEKYMALLVPDIKFRLLLAEDGSGKGAGLAAAIAMKLKHRCSNGIT